MKKRIRNLSAGEKTTVYLAFKVSIIIFAFNTLLYWVLKAFFYHPVVWVMEFLALWAGLTYLLLGTLDPAKGKSCRRKKKASRNFRI
jgi:hypothetical protein